jgi:hypothetical protein
MGTVGTVQLSSEVAEIKKKKRKGKGRKPLLKRGIERSMLAPGENCLIHCRNSGDLVSYLYIDHYHPAL